MYQTCTTPTPFILTPAISTGKPSPNILPYHGNPYFHHQYVPLHRRSAATIHGVLDRIEHRQRSHPSYDPTDEYLNSKSAIVRILFKFINITYIPMYVYMNILKNITSSIKKFYRDSNVFRPSMMSQEILEHKLLDY